MIKKIIPIISVIFFLYSCGYQPIYTNKDKATISISEIIIIGDKDLSKQILSSINITENYGDDSYVLTLNAEHKDNITSKDNSGNPLTFQKSINVRNENLPNKNACTFHVNLLMHQQNGDLEVFWTPKPKLTSLLQTQVKSVRKRIGRQ